LAQICLSTVSQKKLELGYPSMTGCCQGVAGTVYKMTPEERSCPCIFKPMKNNYTSKQALNFISIFLLPKRKHIVKFKRPKQVIKNCL
jgi:hypothetical protein